MANKKSCLRTYYFSKPRNEDNWLDHEQALVRLLHTYFIIKNVNHV